MLKQEITRSNFKVPRKFNKITKLNEHSSILLKKIWSKRGCSINVLKKKSIHYNISKVK